jgi:cellulose synthase/poly-beta-1,6-N-acetylglucosamine synthase-like glycosyltransferase
MLMRVLWRFEREPLLAGLALRLVPEGTSLFSRLQDLEYSIGRAVFGAYTSSQRKLRCVPGAARIWRRKVLLDVLKEHSGRHNGDDLEATAIALRKGYKMGYESSLMVRTLVPQNALELFRQRKRWELGSLETYGRERKFYLSQVKNIRNRLGHVTLLDWYSWCTAVLSPLFLANWFFHLPVALAYALFELGLTVGAGYLARNEISNRKELVLIPLIPIYRFLGSIPRMAALCELIGAKISRESASDQTLFRGASTAADGVWMPGAAGLLSWQDRKIVESLSRSVA